MEGRCILRAAIEIFKHYKITYDENILEKELHCDNKTGSSTTIQLAILLHKYKIKFDWYVPESVTNGWILASAVNKVIKNKSVDLPLDLITFNVDGISDAIEYESKHKLHSKTNNKANIIDLQKHLKNNIAAISFNSNNLDQYHKKQEILSAFNNFTGHILVLKAIKEIDNILYVLTNELAPFDWLPLSLIEKGWNDYWGANGEIFYFN